MTGSWIINCFPKDTHCTWGDFRADNLVIFFHGRAWVFPLIFQAEPWTSSLSKCGLFLDQTEIFGWIGLYAALIPDLTKFFIKIISQDFAEIKKYFLYPIDCCVKTHSAHLKIPPDFLHFDILFHSVPLEGQSWHNQLVSRKILGLELFSNCILFCMIWQARPSSLVTIQICLKAMGHFPTRVRLRKNSLEMLIREVFSARSPGPGLVETFAHWHIYIELQPA